MKKRKLPNKLNLKKSTISRLSLEKAKGGILPTLTCGDCFSEPIICTSRTGC